MTHAPNTSHASHARGSAPKAPGGVPSAHRDTFAREHLPPASAWPVLDYSGIPELAYPDQLNCAVELLDTAVARGWGERVAFRSPSEVVTYGALLDRANRIAQVLVDDAKLVPGERVLLRGANSPMMVALWFAVLKAGGVVVCTMALLRTRELTFVADKARIRVALTDARLADDCEAAMRARADGTTRDGAV
ncbi:MAG: AMP-binding protein, partial [Cytophagaceae bacterium]|nr:AMP-binding protein [Gemmatimonadaceae bacterium]